MEELVKALLEAPDKFKAAIIWCARVVMGMMLATTIYVKLFGPYHLITLTDWPQWVEFLLSGRAFICLLVYIVADQILFGLLHIISIPFYRGMSRLFYKMLSGAKGMKDMIRYGLKFGELLDIDGKTGHIKLMDRSEGLYDALQEMNAKDGRMNMASERDSFLSNIGHTVFAFAFIYFTIMPIYPHYKLLTGAIIIALFGVSVAYAGIQILFDFIKQAGPELADMVAWAKLREVAIAVFMDHDLYVHEKKFRNDETHYCFHFYGKYILLNFEFDPKRCRLYRVEKAVKSAKQLGCFSIVLSNRPVDDTAFEFAAEQEMFIQIVEVASEEDAKEKLTALIKGKFSKPVMVSFNQDVDDIKE